MRHLRIAKCSDVGSALSKWAHYELILILELYRRPVIDEVNQCETRRGER
jgi:hypothetical protein